MNSVTIPFELAKTALLVRFPAGEVVAEEKAADTLVAVIRRAGMERVEQLGILVNGENVVSRSPSKKYNEASAPPRSRRAIVIVAL